MRSESRVGSSPSSCERSLSARSGVARPFAPAARDLAVSHRRQSEPGRVVKATQCPLIGGGPACSGAAKQLREADPEGPIALVGEESYVPYDRPPLSKEFLREEKPRDALFFDPKPYFQ